MVGLARRIRMTSDELAPSFKTRTSLVPAPPKRKRLNLVSQEAQVGRGCLLLGVEVVAGG